MKMLFRHSIQTKIKIIHDKYITYVSITIATYLRQLVDQKLLFV